MALPKIEIVEEDSGDYKHHKTSIALLAERKCSNCDQIIERKRDSEGRLYTPPHNRKVFRGMKQGKPEWVLEVCPGGNNG